MSPSEPGRGKRSPRIQRETRNEFDGANAGAANREMTHKLERNSLQRRARLHGFELRHSAYGYSLIDGERARVDGRNDLTLDEVNARLDAEAAKRGPTDTRKRPG